MPKFDSLPYYNNYLYNLATPSVVFRNIPAPLISRNSFMPGSRNPFWEIMVDLGGPSLAVTSWVNAFHIFVLDHG